MNTTATLNELQQLKLAGMAKHYEGILSLAAHDQPDGHALIAQLTQAELQTLVRNKVYEAHDPEDVSVTLTIDPLSAGVQLAHTTASYPLTFTVPLVGSYSFSLSVSMTVPVIAW